MSSTVKAVRAVTSHYAKDLLRPILVIGIAVYAIIMALVIWITVAVNGWWILLGFIPTILFCVGLAIWGGVWFAARRLSPDMNKTQKKATKEVVEQVSKVAEQLGTPRFILIFRIIKDVTFPSSSKQTLIGELADTPGQLHRSFEALRKLF
jgi:hypothetical protein